MAVAAAVGIRTAGTVRYRDNTLLNRTGETIEFLKRDVLNLAMRNTDSCARWERQSMARIKKPRTRKSKAAVATQPSRRSIASASFLDWKSPSYARR